MPARLTLCLTLLCLSVSAPAWSQRALQLEVRGLSVDFTPLTLLAQSGESLRIGLPALPDGEISASLDGRPAGTIEGRHLLLTAPREHGLYSLRIESRDGQASTLNLFVTVPAALADGGYLNGYRMGPPPPGHPRHPDLYRAPTGYIEVTPQNRHTQLSPHFKLQQFLCKQAGGYPKYVALQESLLVLLEGLLQAVRDAGYPGETFGVVSGYRTPWYNKLIGNVPNSRHVYGDAMDLYIDVDNDGQMDDLDGDGERDFEDVIVLRDIAEEFMGRPENAALVGGIGRYRRTSRHGGFVHVDTRGYPASW